MAGSPGRWDSPSASEVRFNYWQESSMTIPGEGFIVKDARYVGGTDEVRIPVMGRDRMSGRWAAFEVVMPWHHFERLNEVAYDDREEYAQPRIC